MLGMALEALRKVQTNLEKRIEQLEKRIEKLEKANDNNPNARVEITCIDE